VTFNTPITKVAIASKRNFRAAFWWSKPAVNPAFLSPERLRYRRTSMAVVYMVPDAGDEAAGSPKVWLVARRSGTSVGGPTTAVPSRG